MHRLFVVAAIGSLMIACHGESVGDVPTDGGADWDSLRVDAEPTVDSKTTLDTSQPPTEAGDGTDAMLDVASHPPDVRSDPDADAHVEGDAADATPEGGVSPGPNGCPLGRGPNMVRIEVPGKSAYCIDSTEVTIAQLRAFLDDGAPHASSPAYCKWDERPPADTTSTAQNQPAHQDVTWCWAHAFCRWSGKRLCGAIGGGRDARFDLDTSEWRYACQSGGDTTSFPYGNTYQPATCVTEQGDTGSLFGPVADVGSHKSCHGTKAPFDGVYDLSGNVVEYIDDLPASASGDSSTYAHGGWSGGGDQSSCSDKGFPAQPNLAPADSGIRCCATP